MLKCIYELGAKRSIQLKFEFMDKAKANFYELTLSERVVTMMHEHFGFKTKISPGL